MPLVLRAFLDPSAKEDLLLISQDEMRLGRRHQLIGIVGDNAPPCLAFFNVTRSDGLASIKISGSPRERVESQIGAAPVFVWPVAMKTGFRENGADVAIELDGAVHHRALRNGPIG